MIIPILAALGGGFASGFMGEKVRKRQEAERVTTQVMASMIPKLIEQGIEPSNSPELTKMVKGTPIEGAMPLFNILAQEQRKLPQFQARQALTMDVQQGGTFQVPTDEGSAPAGFQAPTITQPERRTPVSPEVFAARAQANPALASVAGFPEVARIGMEEKRFTESKRQFETQEARLQRGQELQLQQEERMAQQWRADHQLRVQQAAAENSYRAASLQLRKAEISATRSHQNETNMRIARSTAGQWAEAGVISPDQAEATAQYLATGKGSLPGDMAKNVELKRMAGQLKEMNTQANQVRDDVMKRHDNLLASLQGDNPVAPTTASDIVHEMNVLLAKDYNQRIAFFEKAGNKEAADALRKEGFSLLKVLVREDGLWEGKPQLVSAETAAALQAQGATLVSRPPSGYILGGMTAEGQPANPEQAKAAFLDSLKAPTPQPAPETSTAPVGGLRRRSFSDEGAPTQEEADAERARREAEQAPARQARRESLLRQEAAKFKVDPDEYLQLRLEGKSASEAVKQLKRR